jgi:hypothetical protein
MRLSWIAFILTCMSGVLYFTGTMVHRRMHEGAMDRLHQVSQELLADLRSYFHDQIRHAKAMVQDPQTRALLSAHGDQNLLAQQLPVQWKDLFVVRADRQSFFSSRKSIAQPFDVSAITNLLDEVPVTLEPTIGEFVQIAPMQMVLPFAFPIVDGGTYQATAVALLDYEVIAQKIRSYQQRLPHGFEILVGKSERSTVEVLFSSRAQTKPFETTYFIEDPSPIARACNGDFGSDTRRYATQWMTSVRVYSPHFHWAVVVQADRTMASIIVIGIRVLSLACLFLALIIGILMLIRASSVLQRSGKILIFGVLASGLLISLLLGYYYGFQYRTRRIDIHESFVSQAKIDIKYVASLLLQHSFAVQAAVRAKSLEIQHAKPSQSVLLPELQNTIFGTSYVASGTQGEPTSYIWSEEKTKIQISFLDQMMSTTTPQWISGVVQQEFGPDVYNIYAEPFFTQQGRLAGFVWATFSYQEIKRIIDVLGHGKSRDAIIFDRRGTVVYEDNFDVVKRRIAAPAFTQAQAGKSGSLYFTKSDGSDWLFLYENLPDMNWSVAISISDKELYVPTNDIHWYETVLICCGVVLFICFIALLLKIYEGSLVTFYLLSVVSSCALIIGIISLIMSNYRYTDRVYQSHALLSELQVMQSREHLEERTGKTYVPLKTNMTLRFIDASSPERIQFSALVRQSINRDRYPHIKLGVELANISDTVTTTTLAHGYHGSEEYVTYHVQGAIYQAKQNYPQIPFDNEPISLRLRSADHTNSVLLVPDFAYYPMLDPAQLPGVLQTFTLKKFKPIKSYFLYVFPDVEKKEALLTFVLLAQRDWVSIVPEYFLPLAVILMTIYLLSLLDDEVARYKRLNIISALSGLFLSLVLLHQRYRLSLVVTGFSYLEALIVMVYMALGYGFINVLILIYRSGLRPYKLALYWPTLLTYVFLVTATLFLRAV